MSKQVERPNRETHVQLTKYYVWPEDAQNTE